MLTPPSMLKAIFIDVGHGLGPTGNVDNGGSASGTNERAEVLEIGADIFRYIQLQPSLKGVGFYMIGAPVRKMLVDHIKDVNTECQKMNWTPADCLLISLHTNIGGASRVETWFENGNPLSQQLGQTILDALVSITGLPNGKNNPDTANNHGRLGIVRDVTPTACLVECGFLDHPTDAAMLKDPVQDDRFAIGIVKGIVKYLGLPYSEVSLDGVYPDVSYDRWSAKQISLMKERGWMTGYGDGLFRPEQAVTREELAVILTRIFPSGQVGASIGTSGSGH